MPKTLKAPKPLSSRRQKSAVQLYHAALALMQENRIDEARELAGRMLGIDENFAPAWDLLAFILS